MTQASTLPRSGARESFNTGSGSAYLYRLDFLENNGFGSIDRLPFSIRVLMESILRNWDGKMVTDEAVERLASYDPSNPAEGEIPFMPARVLLQDFTGVPSIVDLAALRSAMDRLGGDADWINPMVPSDLVIDHSVQVDVFGRKDAFLINSKIEFDRNRERYEFLRWGQQAFENFSVVPPARGIVHQVNLEYLATAVLTGEADDGTPVVYPDSLVGTDSHTTMINGLGVVGWGVGGIEAEAVMLGQPIYMLMPEVVGFKMTGALPEGATATDLVLTVTQILREAGVVGKFVEYFGPGLSRLSVPDRATLANMSPEYGATMGFFPVDAETLAYMRRTGRSEELVETVERYTKEQQLFRTDDTPDPGYSEVIELDLTEVVPSVAGPKLPHARIKVPELGNAFEESLTEEAGPMGFGLGEDDLDNTATYTDEFGEEITLKHGDVAIAAITSCTNTSNPSVMVGAGLLAKNAVERGLEVPSYVKTSLAPGSRVVTEYLKAADLMPSLEELGFDLVGYGCTTCIGNSGPLPEKVSKAVKEGDLIVSGVLSGNRNFEGRIHSEVKANYLASPPLVIAYALAGTVDIDLTTDPIGHNAEGEPVYLKDIWPSSDEILAVIDASVTPELFKEQYEGIEQSNEKWNQIRIPEGSIYEWSDESTYIQEPPFFVDLTPEIPDIEAIEGARTLVKVGDSTTTDHISPAGSIPADSPAGKYLLERGIEPKDFNSYGSRRGNHEVMMRGTFANIRLRNQMAPGTEGGYTTYLPTGEVTSIYDAAMRYIENDTPLLVFAGKQYGTGSSRDWAAKGTQLLGVEAVVAESYERIHRSNLLCMGVLPLQFEEGESLETYDLTGKETFDIPIDNDLQPGQEVPVTATREDGSTVSFTTRCRLDSAVEVEYYRHGGILNYVLREFLETSEEPV
jgi:aconitate hydratase